MTKKVKHHTDKFGALEFKRLEKGSLEWCANPHSRERSRNWDVSLNKNATHIAYIMGHPTAFLCLGCKKEWVKLWKENSSIKYI